MITKVINVNLHQPIYERLTAKQGDIASRYLLFHLLDGDKPFDLSNRTVRVYAIKPDKTEIFNDLTINDASKGYCTLELTSQCLASAGVVKMELYISQSGKVLTSIPFELEVIACINTADSVISTNEFSALEVALSSLQDYDNLRGEIVQARKGHTTVGKRLDNFDSQLDTIRHQKLDRNAILSMSNMGQDVKEAMTGGGVAVVGEDTVLTENIVDNQVTYYKLHSFIQEVFEKKYNNVDLTLNANSYWDYRSASLTSDVDNNNISSVNAIDVSVDETYKVSGYSFYRANLYLILDASNQIIEVFPNTNDAAVLYQDIEVRIPNGGKKMLLNSWMESPTTLERVTEMNVSSNKIIYSPNSIDRVMLDYKMGELFEPCNFLKIPVTWENGGYFRKGTGNVVSDANSSRVRLEVNPGDYYKISGCSCWEANLFYVMDKEENIIQTFPGTNETTKYYEGIVVEIPLNGAFLLVNQRNNAQASTISINQGYYVKNKINKKWVAFGDSLTDAATLGGTYNYTNFVANNLGLELINLGKGGTGYLNGNGGAQQFYNRTSSIPADTDVLTVFGSFNDMFVSNLTIGSITDTGTTTLYGAINTFLSNCWNINPSMIIGIISPTPWSGWWRGDSDVSRVNKCVEYVQVLKTVAEYYSLPFLDLFSYSNLRPWDNTFNGNYYKDADGVHPNTEGHKFIAPKIENFIKSIIQNYD